ncbi:hypothetical protein BBP40_008555 [Aspergillus hancockii]|nr:hypothetical protein BBP40_008555 [Aspergillus hancockii]
MEYRELNTSFEPSPGYSGIARAASDGNIYAIRVHGADQLAAALKEAIEVVQNRASAVVNAEVPLSTWEAAAEAKREAVLNAIPSKWRIEKPLPPCTEVRDVTGTYIQQYLTPGEIKITETDAVGIVEQTSSGNWTAVEVAEAFCHRAALAHQFVSCLHEVFFEAAIETARQLDAYFAEDNKPIGPLHGLPVSLKDQFHVKGVDTTMGYVGWIGTHEGQKADPENGVTESELVRELRNLGAILYCKTSVPTTLMAGETANHIIQYTWNPKNRHLSSGGSSGGEGALLALRGSPVGFGTDIGGSIRIPASFNGVWGLRTSSGRVPYEGAANSMDGQNTMLSVVGPLATTLRSLRFVFKAIISQEPWNYDPLVLELPWRDDLERKTYERIRQADPSSSLAFAIMRHDGSVRPQPPVKRALDMVEQTLRQLGHECFIQAGEHMSAGEVAKVNVEKRQYQKAYLDYWRSTGALTKTRRPVDALFCAAAPHAAVVPGQFRHVGYTSFVNVLDYPSVIIPVTHADKLVDKRESRTDFLSETDKEIFSDYDPEIYDGAPVGIQLVGQRLQEEKLLALAEYASKALQTSGC